MSLLYYILLRAGLGYRSQVFFITIQWSWLVILPLFIIQRFNIDFNLHSKNVIIIVLMFVVILFNFIFYYRETNEKKILKRYTFKFKMIDNHPIICFFVSYFTLIFLGVFLCQFYNK